MEIYSHYAFLIPLLPLLAFLLLTAMGRQMKELGTLLSIIAVLISFVLAVLVWTERLGAGASAYTWNNAEWLEIGGFTMSMGFEINNLNALMLLVVSLVSLLVQVYSKGYMKGDERINVFFAYVSLFTFAMLGLVISENIVQLYIFWELVGLGSFLLIGFWYYKPEAKAAAKKAFIMTRIGDFGFLIGILLLFWHMPGGALDFTSIHNAVTEGKISGATATWVALLIFVGAIGKSGQFPLHTWLPDAMEGPTPISALIHAATMVAAGVYLVARTYDVFQASPDAMLTVAYVGGFTAIFAATIGTVQNDIKRILAYSTVSQLGYMMMALGIGAYSAGIFHLFTHAFFKALLFLAAGSVIHALHTQNIHDMGGAASKMKLTTWTFAIGALALSGIPPFSGFWSKDAILAEAWHQSPLLFAVGIIAAFFTAFYMARLFFLVFTGQPQSDGARQAHESPSVMTLPLVLLAIPAALAGFLQLPGSALFEQWLTGQAPREHHSSAVMIISTVTGLAGIGLGWFLYGRRGASRRVPAESPGGLHRLLLNKYYIDEMYAVMVLKPLSVIQLLLQAFDDYVVGGAVRAVSGTVSWLGRISTRLNNGQLQNYGLVLVLGLVLLVLLLAGRRLINA